MFLGEGRTNDQIEIELETNFFLSYLLLSLLRIYAIFKPGPFIVYLKLIGSPIAKFFSESIAWLIECKKLVKLE
jgi:hypothetical protein